MGDCKKFSGIILKERLILFKDAEAHYSSDVKRYITDVFNQAVENETRERILFTNKGVKNLLLSEIYDNFYKSIIKFGKIENDKSYDDLALRDLCIDLIYRFLQLNGFLCIEDKELCENGILVINIVDISRDAYSAEIHSGKEKEELILSKYVELLGQNNPSTDTKPMELDLNKNDTFLELIRRINYNLYQISSHGSSRFDYMNYRNKILSYIHTFYRDQEKKRKIMGSFNNRQ